MLNVFSFLWNSSHNRESLRKRKGNNLGSIKTEINSEIDADKY